MPLQVPEEGLAPDSKVPSAHLINPPAAVATVDLNLTSFAFSLDDLVRSLLKPEPAPEYPTLDPKLPSKTYEGKVFGAGGLCYPADLSILKMKGLSPEGNAPVISAAINIFVNGACTSSKIALTEAQEVATTSRIPTLCLYNPTEGIVWDVLQVVSDKLDLQINKNADNLCALLLSARQAGIPVCLHGDSHGAVIVSRALCKLEAELLKSMSPEATKLAMSEFYVVTTAGVSLYFPDGPRYRHYICVADMAPYHLGVAPHGLTPEELTLAGKKLRGPPWTLAAFERMGHLSLGAFGSIHPGEGAVIIRFEAPDTDDWLDCHRLETHLKHYKPIEIVHLPHVTQAR